MEKFLDDVMNDPHSIKDQNHPLYASDRDLVDRLLGKDAPSDLDVVDLARLIIRYEGFPGASDLQQDMMKTLRLWGISRESLNEMARKLWEKGFRPGQSSEESIGSGFDTADDVNN